LSKSDWVPKPPPFEVQIRGWCTTTTNGRQDWAYYSDEQFRKILDTFRPRAAKGFRPLDFRRALHRVVTNFLLEVECERSHEARHHLRRRKISRNSTNRSTPA